MNVKMIGKNPTAQAGRMNAPNAKAQTFTEHHKTEDTLQHVEEEEDTAGMGKIRIAIPCEGEATLQAKVSPHFGRCGSYAIVTLQDGQIVTVESLSNSNHADCSSPVEALSEHSVGLMLVAGMGMRPYLSFRQHGIVVNYGAAGTVADTIASFLRNETTPMTEDTLCGCHETSQLTSQSVNEPLA
jgi:predicted Fe-Mo cluster-binding NifX family protein